MMGNKKHRLVGAPGFEPGASCAQGRRATRLRYAPTVTSILAYFWKFTEVPASAAAARVRGEYCGVTFAFAGFAGHSRSARPYATMNQVQYRVWACSSERK